MYECLLNLLVLIVHFFNTPPRQCQWLDKYVSLIFLQVFFFQVVFLNDMITKKWCVKVEYF